MTDRELEKLLQPILKRQEDINDYVIDVIAKRVKQIGRLTPSDVYKLERILKSGSDAKEITKEIAKLTGVQEKEIRKLIETVAKRAYLDAKPYYDYRGLSFIPFEENEPLQRVVKAIAKQTSDSYVNLAKAQAFMIRDLKNPKKLKPTSLSKTYYSVVDEAIQAVQQGTIDYNTAMRRTMTQLVDSGIRNVTYHPESGRVYTQRLDTAIRRNLQDGIRAINQGVQDEVGRQYGADGKEITVHAMSAPDHEPVQGHQFTNEQYEKLQNEEAFQDLNGNKFSPIKRAIGTLNCKHFAYSIICGVSKPVFTQAQLDEYIRKNQQGYTLPNGKHLTLYECTQKQRSMETDIRKAKNMQMAFNASGDSEGEQKARAKVIELQKRYKSFSNACGISQQKQRTVVAGYKK